MRAHLPGTLYPRRCPTCQLPRAADDFTPNGNRRRSECRECTAERQRRYYEANPEKVAKRNRRYREAHREKEAERNRRYREAHREKVAERKRRYRETHREEESERERRYRETHREEESERYRRYHEANYAETRPKAHKHGNVWTSAELTLAMNTNKTVKQVALELGRTADGVRNARRRCSTEPKFAALVDWSVIR